MTELCKGQAIPKEFLANVAQALTKKVVSKPEFDTQNLRTNDILLDLMERAPLSEQRSIMKNLTEANADGARAIKLKLVTLEMLPYLKDGHLLELVLGLEREDLLSFLVGSPEHIRKLLISHAPAELAQSWMEDLENMSGVEETKYQAVEAKVLSKCRQLASSGAISLIDINDIIFNFVDQAKGVSGPQLKNIPRRNIVA